jgi:ATP-dependent helicase/nuclease subunit A
MNINNYLKPGKSINVVAAAGTGKTWIIISKILRLLLDDVSPDKITAITFTKKSSAEMMGRLNEKIELWSDLNLQALEIELKEIGVTENIKVYSYKAKKLFVNIQLSTKDIRISTFDAFFVEILSLLHLDK